MKSTKGVVCRACRGLNQPGSEFCWFCGAPLRRRWFGFAERRTTGGWVVFGLKWIIGIAAVVAVAGGLYYAVDRYLLPLFEEDTTTGTSIVRTTTTGTDATTTTLARTDRTVRAGADRYATAAAISKLGFPEGAPALVLVAGDDYAQAISAAPLAAAYGGPMLLVPPEGIRDDISAEIERLSPSLVFLVGVSKPRTVTQQLEEILDEPAVTNLTGDDAYETAALIAEQLNSELESVPKVVIVPSDSFVEGLAVAPLAAAEGWPILLASGDDLPRATSRAMEKLEVESVLMVGTGAEVDLDDVERRMEDDSFGTAASVIEYADTQGMSYLHTVIATGDAFPDALAAVPYLALDKGILLLTHEGQLPPPMLSLYTENLEAIRTLDVIALPGLQTEPAGPSGTAE